jgi:hypothetical protein
MLRPWRDELAQPVLTQRPETQGVHEPVRTAAPACETSDWPVKLTGTEGKTEVNSCIERVLLHSANNGLDNHYFPQFRAPFP